MFTGRIKTHLSLHTLHVSGCERAACVPEREPGADARQPHLKGSRASHTPAEGSSFFQDTGRLGVSASSLCGCMVTAQPPDLVFPALCLLLTLSQD